MMFVFPGQGSHFLGMGMDFMDKFSVAKDVFNEVDESLGYSLSDIIKNGPIEELTKTENAQPAILATSVAILKSLLFCLHRPFVQLSSYVAGHSLGEYSALCATGSISLWDAVRIVRFRGEAMSRAFGYNNGGMVAILGFNEEDLIDLLLHANRIEFCQIANDNTAEQIVISGHMAAIDFIVENYKNFKIKKAIKLNVSAPFHSKLIHNASLELNDFLNNFTINNSIIPLISNVTTELVVNSHRIRELLVQQVFSRVRWRESMLLATNNNVNTFIEIGPGSALSKMINKISPNVKTLSISNVSDLENMAKYIDEDCLVEV